MDACAGTNFPEEGEMLQNPAKSHRCCASSPHHSPPLPSSLPRPTLPRANLCYARHRTSRCAAHLRHACHQPTSVTPAIHPTPIAFDPTLLAAAVLAAAVLIATVLAVAVPAPAVPVAAVSAASVPMCRLEV